MAIVTLSVSGQILHPDGLTPAVGTVVFQLPIELYDVVDNIVYSPDTWSATLSLTGTFTITGLIATDSPDITPTDWLYRVHVSTDAYVKSYSTSLPAALAPVAEFADLIPASSEPCTQDGTPCATVAQFAALQAEVDAVEVEVDAIQVQIPIIQADLDAVEAEVDVIQATYVQTVNGEPGPNVVLSAGDVGADPAGSAAAALAAAQAYTDAEILALDATVVHLAGAESITGVKTFTADPVFNVAAIPQVAVVGLVADLASKVTGPAAATNTALARFDGVTGKLIKDSPTTTLTDGGMLVNRGDVFVRKPDASGEFAQRVSGGGLDYDAAGYDLFFSTWSGTGVGIGVQRVYMRAESGAALMHAIGRWIWATGPFGATVHALDPVTGVAELGGKNGLTTINLVGRGAVPGAPVAGAWNLGDLMIDSVGVWHYCTAGGTPGTWT